MKPRISIVVPSYNQATYLHETLASITGQQYPNLELIVMDGGSTDSSVDVIRRFEDHITYWQSQKDDGQADAINCGFERATGDIFCWLNSDDYFLPGSLDFVSRTIDPDKLDFIAGNCFHFYEDSADSSGSDVAAAHEKLSLEFGDYLIQPSTFWTRQVWEKAGLLDRNLRYTFDWDWYLRAKRFVSMRCANRYLSAYRRHPEQKTVSGNPDRIEELFQIYRRYGGVEVESAARAIFADSDGTEWWERTLYRLRLKRIRLAILKLLKPEIYGTLGLPAVSQIRNVLK